MNKEKNFIQLLIMYSMNLLAPVVIISLLVIFFYFNKLEIEFEKLNTKTMETANIYIDGLVEDVHVVSFKLSADEDVHSFLTSAFRSNKERVSVLSNIKNEIGISLVNKDIIENIAIYSKINDVFIDKNSVFKRKEYYERYFSQSEYMYEELFEALDHMGVTPVWLVTDEYLIYCSAIKVSGYTNKGIFLATIKKEEMLHAVLDICDSFDMSYALLHREQDILLQTENFMMKIYEAVSEAESLGKHYQNYFLRKYSSRSLGEVEYVYVIENESFGGNVEQMVRHMIMIIFLIFGLCIILTRRKVKQIRNMYVDALEENVKLGKDLNVHIERLNRQLVLNALRGYEFLSFDKPTIQIRSTIIRVMVIRVVDGEQFEDGTQERQYITDTMKNCLATEKIEHVFLFEKSVGYIWVLGYEVQEKLERAVQRLQRDVEGNCSRKLYIGMSTEISDVAKLSEAYESAETALKYCVEFHEEEGGLVQYADIMELEKTKIYYTAEKEKQLLHSIRLGMSEEAEKCLEHIYRMNFEERRLSKGAARQLLVKLLNTVYELIDIVYDGAVDKYDEFGRVSRKVMQSDDMESAFEMIKSIALYTCTKSSGRKEGELRERIIVYLNDKFMDPDMSLGKMASDFGMSYYHLSRLFNEYMQMNFAAYLTGIRLNYSRELLSTMSYTVEQVATKSGFIQTNSFVRAFKKYYGVTPEKYCEECGTNI